MELIKIMLQYLAKQHGISEEAAAELLFEQSEDGKVDQTKLKTDILSSLIAKDKERVTALKTPEGDKTEIYNRAFADAKKEILPKVEKKLAEKYGIEGKDFKLDDLVDKIVAKQLETNGNKIDNDSVKKHPAYLALERAKTEEATALKTEHETKLLDIQNGYSRKETLQTVRSEVLSRFVNLNPVLSKDAVKANNSKERFVNQFNEFEYELQTDGGYLITQNGKRLEDGHGNAKTLDMLVNETASKEFDFVVQDKRGSTGNDGQAGGSGGKTFTVPDSKEAYALAVINATTAEERTKLKDSFEATQK